MNGSIPYLPALPLTEREAAVLNDLRALVARGVNVDSAIGLIAARHRVNPIHVDRLCAFALGRSPEIYGESS